MKVKVRLLANFKQFGPGGESHFELQLDPGSTMASLLLKLQVPSTVSSIMLLNGKYGREDTHLAEGDTITLFPPIEGG